MPADVSHVSDPVIINTILQLFAMVIMAVGTWAISRFVQWLNLKNAAQITAGFDDVLQKGVTYGLQQTETLIKQQGWDSVTVKNAAIASGAQYVIDRFPDILKSVGLDLKNPAAVQATVIGALNRAYPQAVTAVAASPATPPASISAISSAAPPAAGAAFSTTLPATISILAA